jgi:hypothetical protein
MWHGGYILLESLKTFETSNWIALASVVSALSALVLTIWQGLQTRKHNRLSAKPYVGFSWVNKPLQGLRCELKNLGLGPALISQIRFFVDNNEVKIKNRESYKSLFEALEINKVATKIEVFHTEPHSALSVGQSESLIVFCDSSISEGDHKLIASKLRRFSVQVEYKCIYGISYQTSRSGLL